LLEKIESGEIHLSTLVVMAPYLTDENVHELVEETRDKTRNRVEAILAERFGAKLFLHRYGPMLVMDEELEGLITWARDHFSNAVPDRDLTKVTKRVFTELKERVEREEREALKPPKPSTKKTKRIPRRYRRYVHARDSGRCTYVDPRTGERCPAKGYISLDHILGEADGGDHDPDNLRVACRAHNLWFAELRYGKEYIAKRIRQRKRKSPPPEGPTEPNA